MLMTLVYLFLNIYCVFNGTYFHKMNRGKNHHSSDHSSQTNNSVYIYIPISTHLRVLTVNTADSERNLNVEYSRYQPQLISGHVISERSNPVMAMFV